MISNEIYLTEKDIHILQSAVNSFDKLTDEAYRKDILSLKKRLDVQIFKIKFDTFMKKYYNSKVNKNKSTTTQKKC